MIRIRKIHKYDCILCSFFLQISGIEQSFREKVLEDLESLKAALFARNGNVGASQVGAKNVEKVPGAYKVNKLISKGVFTCIIDSFNPLSDPHSKPHRTCRILSYSRFCSHDRCRGISALLPALYIMGTPMMRIVFFSRYFLFT